MPQAISLSGFQVITKKLFSVSVLVTSLNQLSINHSHIFPRAKKIVIQLSFDVITLSQLLPNKSHYEKSEVIRMNVKKIDANIKNHRFAVLILWSMHVKYVHVDVINSYAHQFPTHWLANSPHLNFKWLKFIGKFTQNEIPLTRQIFCCFNFLSILLFDKH